MKGSGRTVIIDPRSLSVIRQLTGVAVGGHLSRKGGQGVRRQLPDHWPPPMMTATVRAAGLKCTRGPALTNRYGQCQMRVIQGFEAAIDIAEGRNLAIVTHAGPIAV